MKSDDDKILLAELLKSNEKAFELIFNKYFNNIYYFISQNCKSTEDAKDLTQEVFVRLWENRSTPIFSLKGYLFTIAKNVIIDKARRDVNKYVLDALTEEQHAIATHESESNDDSAENLYAIIHRIAKAMPERRLEVYNLRWIEGLSRKEIAKKLGITIITVDNHLQKGLEFLRKTIAKIPDRFL